MKKLGRGGEDSTVSRSLPIVADIPQEGAWPNLYARWKTKANLAMALGSTATTFVTSPLSNTLHELERMTIWVAPSMITAEALWIGGGAMMLAAVGEKLKNPFAIKRRVPEIAEKATSSGLFKSGFWLNTSAAVAEFVIPTAGIVTELPPQSWGVSALFAADLAVTVAVRKTILGGIRKHTGSPNADITGQATFQPEVYEAIPGTVALTDNFSKENSVYKEEF